MPGVRPRVVRWHIDRWRVRLCAVRRGRRRRRGFSAWQHEGADKGGELSDAGGEQVDHDDPAKALHAADGRDHAGQDVQAEQDEDQRYPEEVAVG